MLIITHCDAEFYHYTVPYKGIWWCVIRIAPFMKCHHISFIMSCDWHKQLSQTGDGRSSRQIQKTPLSVIVYGTEAQVIQLWTEGNISSLGCSDSLMNACVITVISTLISVNILKEKKILASTTVIMTDYWWRLARRTKVISNSNVRWFIGDVNNHRDTAMLECRRVGSIVTDVNIYRDTAIRPPCLLFSMFIFRFR